MLAQEVNSDAGDLREWETFIHMTTKAPHFFGEERAQDVPICGAIDYFEF